MHRNTDEFWAGQFGNEYTARNVGRVAANFKFFQDALKKAIQPIESVLEYGAGSGENLQALRGIMPGVMLKAVEINAKACESLIQSVHVLVEGSMFDPAVAGSMSADLVVSKGLLIHINPLDLRDALRIIHDSSMRYILLAEYHSPHLQEIDYRGHARRLWKGPYAEIMMDMFKDIKLVDHGFAWSRDEQPQDDLTYFLLERT